MRVPFAIQSYRNRSLPVSAQQIVNMFVENQPEGSKAQTPIFGVPGLVQFSAVGSGPIRGIWNMAGVLYVVSGQLLYSVSSTGASTFLGGSVSGSGNVSMSDNGTQLIIVNGENGYVWSESVGFVRITSVGFNPAKTVTFFDNYFVLDHVDTNQFFISDTLDGLNYDPLNYASAEVQPDYVLATINQQENLLIFGQTTIETWYDSGDVNFPFNRYDGATIERGCASALAIVKEDNSVFFIGNDGMAYRLNGVIPTRISTYAIETAWSQYQTIADATAFSYTYQGHKWVVFTFPTGNATWVYDIATSMWHERVSFTAQGVSMQRWRVSCYANCYGKQLVGDNLNGIVGYIDANTYTEYGNPIQAFMVSPIIHDDRNRVFIYKFELDVESGVGLTSGQGSDPQVMLNWSDDGGRTFSALQQWHSMGKIGEYKKRLRWLRLGQARNRVFKVTISDPTIRTIIDNSVTVRAGTN